MSDTLWLEVCRIPGRATADVETCCLAKSGVVIVSHDDGYLSVHKAGVQSAEGEDRYHLIGEGFVGLKKTDIVIGLHVINQTCMAVTNTLKVFIFDLNKLDGFSTDITSDCSVKIDFKEISVDFGNSLDFSPCCGCIGDVFLIGLGTHLLFLEESGRVLSRDRVDQVISTISSIDDMIVIGCSSGDVMFGKYHDGFQLIRSVKICFTLITSISCKWNNDSFF
ncbi:hypothetical protein GEMRC1_012998 [Eukaryota sp. GEM-RC1]